MGQELVQVQLRLNTYPDGIFPVDITHFPEVDR